MKKFISSMKTKLIPLLLLFIMTLAAVILPAATLRAFALLPAATLRAFALPGSSLKDPSLWQGGGGGSADRNIRSVFIVDEHAYEIKHFTNLSLNSSNKYEATGYDYVENRISSRPTETTTYNTIDYVIYMIRQLESYAREYLDFSNGASKIPVNNLVLGFIRAINRNYTSEYADKWALICGEYDINFINYVLAKDQSNDLTLLEFFSSFLQDQNSYNSKIFGSINQNLLNKHFYIPDPLESDQYIDLIHMIAAIDGIYKYTEQTEYISNIVCPNNH